MTHPESDFNRKVFSPAFFVHLAEKPPAQPLTHRHAAKTPPEGEFKDTTIDPEGKIRLPVLHLMARMQEELNDPIVSRDPTELAQRATLESGFHPDELRFLADYAEQLRAEHETHPSARRRKGTA